MFIYTLCYALCKSLQSYLFVILWTVALQAIGVDAIPFSKGSSQPRDQTPVSCFASRFFTTRTTWEAHSPHQIMNSNKCTIWFVVFVFFFSLTYSQCFSFLPFSSSLLLSSYLSFLTLPPLSFFQHNDLCLVAFSLQACNLQHLFIFIGYRLIALIATFTSQYFMY